ncbi:MAG: HDIG domain-containing protein [Paludibacteraceae bacterium]|nr:HDIG domain-containing protein [Paludibacteraceae bacterium]
MSKTLKIILIIGAYLALAALTVYLFPRYNNAFNYHFEIGKPWGYDLVTAEFDFPIYKTDAEVMQQQREALQSITPCYIKTADLPNGAFVLSLEDFERLQTDGYKRVSVRTDKHVATTLSVSELMTPKTAYECYGEHCDPNIVPDTLTNARLYQNAIESVSLTFGLVQSGERIIDRGEIVTAQTYQILTSLARAYSEKNITRQQTIYVQIGYLVLIVLLIALFVSYLAIIRPNLFREVRATLFFCILMALLIAASFLILRFSADDMLLYIVPFAWLSILTTVFYDSRTAFVLHFITVFIVSLAAPSPFMFLFTQGVAGIVVIYSLRKMTQRAHLAHTALLTGLTYALVYTALTFTATGTYTHLQLRVYMFIVADMVLIICAYGVIYIFERTFGLVSDVTLIELSNVNSELMHRFAEEAPGTFQHTLQVSNLATEAAKKIEANALLVRTGALYHDIGKLMAPQNFTENQQLGGPANSMQWGDEGGDNPLLRMTNVDAAQTVIRHVSDGLSLAAKQGLPQVIRSFIASHHGTSLVRYFYNSEANAHPDQTVDEALFRYPGPKPTTKETAILMMADAVEARSRSLKDYTEQSIADMVNQMIDAQIQDGQFAETPLSFRDVEAIREVFTEKLIAIHHQRIAYPTLQNKK